MGRGGGSRGGRGGSRDGADGRAAALVSRTVRILGARLSDGELASGLLLVAGAARAVFVRRAGSARAGDAAAPETLEIGEARRAVGPLAPAAVTLGALARCRAVGVARAEHAGGGGAAAGAAGALRAEKARLAVLLSALQVGAAGHLGVTLPVRRELHGLAAAARGTLLAGPTLDRRRTTGISRAGVPARSGGSPAPTFRACIRVEPTVTLVGSAARALCSVEDEGSEDPFASSRRDELACPSNEATKARRDRCGVSHGAPHQLPTSASPKALSPPTGATTGALARRASRGSDCRTSRGSDCRTSRGSDCRTSRGLPRTA